MLYAVAKAILYVLISIYHRAAIYGSGRIPKTGGFILAANHSSYLDPVYLGTKFPIRLYFMAKAELFRKPWFAKLLSLLGAFPVKRETGDIGAFRKSLAILKDGGVLLMFPGGSRHADAGAKEVKGGAAFIAMKTGVPVLPVFIEGTDRALPPSAKWVRPVHISVYVGELIYPSDLGDARDEAAVAEASRRIAEGIDRARSYAKKEDR